MKRKKKKFNFIKKLDKKVDRNFFVVEFSLKTASGINIHKTYTPKMFLNEKINYSIQ